MSNLEKKIDKAIGTIYVLFMATIPIEEKMV